MVGDDAISEAQCSDQLIDTCVSSTMSANELSSLKYFNVRVANDDTKENKVILALCDTGAEICCLDAGLATDLAPNIVGQIQLRPFCGDSVNAGLARFTVSLCDNDAVDDDNRSVDVWCAIVPDLHDKFILTADAVRRLSECNAKLSRVTTRSSSKSVDASHNDNDDDSLLDDDKSDGNINVQTVDGNSDMTEYNDDKTSSDAKSDDFATSSDDSVASRDELINEQRADPTLKGCFKLGERNRGGFVIKDELLYHRATILGQTFLQLVVPKSRRDHVLKMGHDTFGGHMSVKRTKSVMSHLQNMVTATLLVVTCQ